ncbi:MAG: Crp/Fnr family transcriptional regulator, partial [Pedobacter sp.]
MLQNFKSYITAHSKISEAQFDKLAQNLKYRKVKKGEFLLREGEICIYSFFVSHGLLRSYTINELGKEHIIQFAPEDWIITDRSSAFFNQSSELYIDAIEDSEIVFVSTEFIKEISDLDQEFTSFNNRALHSHILHLQKRVNLLLGATAEQRYLDFIKLYPSLTLRLPQWMIASYLG